MADYSSYRTEIDPTDRQKKILDKNFDACRKIFNLYLSRAMEQYDKTGKYENVEEFVDWFYKIYMRSQKLSCGFPRGFNNVSIKKVCRNVNIIMDRYASRKIGRPRSKSEKYGRASLYFANIKSRHEYISCERHRIYAPGFGWIRLKEKGYIPFDNKRVRIVSGFISEHLGRYYISVNVDNRGEGSNKFKAQFGEPLGIDMGLNWFAVLSDRRAFKNINKDRRVVLLEKRAVRLERSLSRKSMSQKDAGLDERSANYEKTKYELEKTYCRIHNIRSNYLNAVISRILITHPRYIAIEDLDVSEMIKERVFSRSISRQMFYEFRERLIKKCAKEGIEVRIVDRWFPSSKRCHNCGRVKKRLLLNEREFICECGYRADRDLNAGLNLRDADEYTIARP